MRKYTVAVYRGCQMYGGPEEGGWWYWGGDLVGRIYRRFTKNGAYRLARRLREKFPPAGDRYTAARLVPEYDAETDYSVEVGYPGEPLGQHVPAERPYYE